MGKISALYRAVRPIVLILDLGESDLAFRITTTTPKLPSGICSTLCDPRDRRLVTSRTRRRRCEDGMRHRSRTGIPGLAEKRWKFPAVDQLDVAPFSERDCILGKTARGHDIAAGGLLGRHDAVQLTHDGDGYLPGSPLLTLHQEALSAACEDEINAAIGSCSAFFGDLESTLPKSFS